MSRIQTFSIALKPISWNKIIAKGWRNRKQVFDEWSEQTALSVMAYRIAPIKKYPVSIAVSAFWEHKNRHDIDSLVFKPVLDALVTLGVLKDDNLKMVSHVSFQGSTDQEEDCMVVSIEESS